MKYLLWFSTAEYEPMILQEYETESELLFAINNMVDNPDFTFRVFRGSEIKYKAVQVVTRYEKE